MKGETLTPCLFIRHGKSNISDTYIGCIFTTINTFSIHTMPYTAFIENPIDKNNSTMGW
jgi:hypothetical protein